MNTTETKHSMINNNQYFTNNCGNMCEISQETFKIGILCAAGSAVRR